MQATHQSREGCGKWKAMRASTVKLMAVCVACATFFATLSSVKYLATLIAHQHSAQLTNKHTYEFTGHAEWHEVIDRAEENIEHHLPSWLHKDKAGGVGASVHPGSNPRLPNGAFHIFLCFFIQEVVFRRFGMGFSQGERESC